MKEVVALPLVHLFPLLGKHKLEVKGLLTAEFEKQAVPFWVLPVCTHPSAKGRLYLLGREVNAVGFPPERTKAFAFIRSLFEF